MRYNTELQNNNAELQAILDSVNGLPSAGGESVNWYDYAFSLHNHFKSVEFAEGTEITLNLPNVGEMNSAFNMAKGVKRVNLILGENDVTMSSCFWMTNDGGTLEIVDLSKSKCRITKIGGCFRDAKKLKCIYGELDFSYCSDVNAMFLNTTNIEEIRFKQETILVSISFAQSSMLSAESIQSIINGLADLTGGTSQTIAFHKDVKSKLTEEQISQITSKNWTLA